MSLEDLGSYFSVATGFAVAATLAGAPVTGIFSTGSTDVYAAGGSTITQEPIFDLLASAAPAAAAGQALVLNGNTYTVRSVHAVPPDGLVQRLTLARV